MGYYSATAHSYNELHGKEQMGKAEMIRQHLPLHGLLLDIGAGTGIATALFQEKCECIALEPSIEMLKQFSGIKVCAIAEQLPFKKNSFDCVVSITALHHCNLGTAFNEIRRAAKRGAKIAVSFFKRAANFRQAEKLFRNFERIDSQFDTIFLKK